jgi:hypothetical protein
MEWLCWLFGALLVITLLGHGIWVAIATLVRPRKTAPPAAIDRSSPLDDLLKTEIQLAQLLDAGLIDIATYSRVRTALKVVRTRGISAPAIPQAKALEPMPVIPIERVQDDEFDQLPPIEPEMSAPPPLRAAVPVAEVTPKKIPARPPAPPRPPWRPFSEVFAAFLRDSNIRWGELIGGLLIVGCSVALVISFWGQIAAKPFFQFGLFTGVTTATLALGLYAEHRWKLPTTSRGILLIATMLVPLNFLALAALAHGARASLVVTAGEVGAMILFGILIWQAAKVLAPYWPHLLTAGVVLLSASLLIIQQFHGPRSSSQSLALGVLPVTFYAGTIALMLRRAASWKLIRARAADAIFLMLGVLTFAAALSLGLLILPAPAPFAIAHDLSPLLSISAAPALAAGLLLWRRITNKRVAKSRTIGTAIAVAAAFLMLGCLSLAWPDPRTLLPLAALDLIVFTSIALRLDVPAAHALAAPCVAIVYALALELSRGRIGWSSSSEQTLSVLWALCSGLQLLSLFVILSGGAWFLARRRRFVEAAIYGWSAVAIAAINLFFASKSGFALPGDPGSVTWLYLAYATASLLAARRYRLPTAGWIGSVLLIASFLQFFVTRTDISHPWATALLAYATVALIAAIARRRDAPESAAVLRPARWTAIISTAAALLLLLAGLSFPGMGSVAVRLLWASGLCLAMSAIENAEPLFVPGQLVLAVSACLAVLSRLSLRPWFAASPDPLLDSWTLQALGIALATVAFAFSLIRLAAPASWRISGWLRPEYAFDRILSLLLAAGFAALAIGAFAPGLGIELSPTDLRSPIDAWSVHAAGAGSWLIFAELCCTLALWLRGRFLRVAYLVLCTLVVFACLLWAARFAADSAAASAARWALATVLLAGSIPLWWRRRLPQSFDPVAAESRMLLTALAAIPVLALSLHAVASSPGGELATGPSHACFFGKIGLALSHLIPLVIVAIVFIVNAVRERSAGWSLASSGVINLAVTLLYSLSLAHAAPQPTGHTVARYVQINVIAVALFALAWQAIRRGVGIARRSPLQRVHTTVALAGNAVLLIPAALALAFLPGTPQPLLATIGSIPGWVALLATAVAVIWLWESRLNRLSPATVTLIALGLGILAASTIAARAGGWMGYHVLMVAAVFAGGANLAAGIWVGQRRRGWAEAVPLPEAPAPVPGAPLELQYARPERPADAPVAPAIYIGGELLQSAVLRWTAMANVLAVLLSIRAMIGDPQRPWWSAAITATIALLWAALACWLLAPRLLYGAAALLNLSATFWFLDKLAPASAAPLLDLALANIAVLATSGIAALVLHLNVFQVRPTSRARPAWPPFHRFAAIVSLMIVLIAICVAVAADVGGPPHAISNLITWAAIAPTLLLAAAMLWDADAPHSLAEIYVLGLAVMVAALHQVDYFHQPIEVVGAAAMSGYVLLTCLLYSRRGTLARIASGFGMPTLRRDDTSGWLAPASIVLLAATIALALRGDFVFNHLPYRLFGSSSIFSGLAGLLILTRGDRRMDLRYVILVLFPLAGTACAWSWMSPLEGEILSRAVVLTSVLAVTLVAFGWMAMGRSHDSPWVPAARRAAGPMAIAWAASLLAVLGIEIAAQFAGEPPRLAGWAVAVVLANLMAGAAASVFIALVPALDPLKFPDSRRGSYVYLAEAMLALSFVHLRLTAPWLFGGVFSQYWPLLVMALAFGGMALGELFRRRGTIALSSPLFRTGAFLPLLPVIAFWAAPSRVDLSTLLFTVGVFYAVLSATRRSFAFGVLAALAANGGLWSLLARQPSLAFLVHPQVWLIPAAVSVLIAAQLNRDRLAPVQLRFVRYCCLMMVYVSSTADIFLNGVKDHPWLPLVLAGLSVIGVMLGILFRLRAFLFLGTAFLGLAIITMIYYASADLHWTWLWYVAGIVLGASILAMFALFEKKRAEMLALVDGLKRWE